MNYGPPLQRATIDMCTMRDLSQNCYFGHTLVWEASVFIRSTDIQTVERRSKHTRKSSEAVH